MRPPHGASHPAAESSDRRARMAAIAIASRPRDGSAAAPGGDDADTEARRQSGQRGVAFVVEG
ncbi:hypothetical protein ACQKB2_18080 [Mycobacterium tuberculosis]